jgi:hypothetical protein
VLYIAHFSLSTSARAEDAHVVQFFQEQVFVFAPEGVGRV